MVTQHCIDQIEKRGINIDPEMVDYLTTKSAGVDSAFVLGEQQFLGDNCWIILIVRDYKAITIEFRRKTQSLSKDALQVEQIVKFPCMF